MKWTRLAVINGLVFLPLLAHAEGIDFVPLTSLPGLTEVASTSSLAPFLSQVYKMCIGLAAVLAVLQLMRAGIMYMGGDSVTEKKQARELITLSLVGLLLVLSPVIVFSIINPDILNLDIHTSNLKSGASGSESSDTPSTESAIDSTEIQCSAFIQVRDAPPTGICNDLPGAWVDIPSSCDVCKGKICCGRVSETPESKALATDLIPGDVQATGPNPGAVVPSNDTLNQGVHFLEKQMADKTVNAESAYVYVEYEDGTHAWKLLSTGKQGSVSYSGQDVLDAVGTNPVKTITLLHTHPSQGDLRTASPPSPADIETSILWRDIYGSKLSADMAVEQNGAWAYRVDTGSTYYKDVQENNQRIANIRAIPGFLEQSQKYMNDGGNEAELLEKAIHGDFGTEAKKQAKEYEDFYGRSSHKDIQTGLNDIGQFWNAHTKDPIGDVLIEHGALDSHTAHLKAIGVTLTFDGYTPDGSTK